MQDLKPFSKMLGYDFKSKKLLLSALTHPSAFSPSVDLKFHYERLELLGDAILGFAMKDILFNKHPDYREGQLSQKFSFLTSRDCCYKVGLKMGIHDFMHISKGEEKNGGRLLKTNIANTLEAILGAVYLDCSDVAVCKNLVAKHWGEFLDLQDYLEPKTALQEWSQNALKSLPQYSISATNGPDHNPKFLVEVLLSNGLKSSGEGKSKKMAEQNAARNMLGLVRT